MTPHSPSGTNKLRRTGSRSTDTVRIESAVPGFANLAPVAGTNTTSRVPRLSAEITDAESGVVESSIEFEVIKWVDANNDNKVQFREEGDSIASEPGQGADYSSPFTTALVDAYRVTTTAITGGFSATIILPRQGTGGRLGLAGGCPGQGRQQAGK